MSGTGTSGQSGGIRIVARLADITGLEVDAVVNAASTAMRGGGGVDGAIHRAGGREVMDDCIRRALQVADGLGVRRIAFPLISAGIYGWPLDDAIACAVQTVAATPTRVEAIVFAVVSEPTLALVEAEIARLPAGG